MKQNCRNLYKKGIVLFFIILILLLIFYYSWLPDSELKTETYLPKWLLKWCNYYFNLRTAIPFVPLGYLLEVLNPISKRKSIINNSYIVPFWFQNSSISALVVCIAEGGQFFITNRNPDILDIVFGILGSVFGVIIYYLIKKITKLFFFKNA